MKHRDKAMRKVIFECDVCHKKTDAIPDRPNPSNPTNIPDGWKSIFARLGETAEAMGVTLMDGAHACSEACAREIVCKGLSVSKQIVLD